jgi:hypothetical protein
MEQPRFDRDRMLMYTTLLGGLVSIGFYVTLYLTMAIYGALNSTGILIGRVALYVATGTLGVSLVLALTARNTSLLSASLSGWGWFLVFGGIALLFPAWGLSMAPEAVPGVSGFGGYAGAILLILSGGLLAQAERTVRERQETATADPPGNLPSS